jgi:hypothetical protein
MSKEAIFMPSYSFQSIIQSIIDFFKSLFITKTTSKIPSRVIKNRVTHAIPPKLIKNRVTYTSPPKLITLPYGIKINPNIDKTTTKTPSQVIKNRVTHALPPTSQHINPIITRTNIVTYPLPPSPYLPLLPNQILYHNNVKITEKPIDNKKFDIKIPMLDKPIAKPLNKHSRF